MKNIYLCLFASALLFSMQSEAQSITSHSVNPIDTSCAGPVISLTTSAYTSTLFAQTFFGDGTFSWTPIMSGGSTGYAAITHSYDASGTYFIRQMLFNGAVAVDSITETFEYLYCRSTSLTFYNDINGNGLYDASVDQVFRYPFLVEVDSAGVVVDTLACTSGVYYKEHGIPGTVYSFKILSHPGGAIPSSPASGIIYDTIQASVPVLSLIKYAGLTCGSSAFDVAEHVTTKAGRHHFSADILVNNPYCAPESATLTMRLSPKYNYQSAYPVPASVVGNTITWNLTGLALGEQRKIQVGFEQPTWLTPGDTIHSEYSLSSPGGDVDTNNNHYTHVDTVTGSWDPNYKAVSPEGIVRAGTRLNYTVNFENTGNDTAFNIYVMDTLSDNVDPQSLEIIAASAVMNVSRFYGGGHNILKFDFPGINLPDSSHHGQCDGMVMYSLNTKAGLPVGTKIDNEAGIYFDCNAVVMTNPVENTIGNPAGIAVLGNAENNVVVFPNPANDELNIKVEDGTYNCISISNAIGQRLLSQPLTGGETKVNVGSLPAGIYFIVLKGAINVKVVQFEKQ